MKKRSFGCKNLLLILFVVIFSLNISVAQKSKSKSFKNAEAAKESVVASIGKEKITFSDLEKAYKKNMNRKESNLYDISQDSIRDFLSLYVNYRLKVLDALKRGFDKDSAVQADIKQNRRILAESFFYEKKLVEPKVEEMLKLRDRELQFAYILVKTPALMGTDTLKAYNKAKACINLIKNGKEFAAVAIDSSEDKETANKGGVVPNFVTSGRIQRPIEHALYSIKPGEVFPEPVRFREGYLVLKLLRSEPRYKVKVSQILLSEGLEKDSARVYRKADSLIALLKKGASFKKLAEENSEDPATAVKGGEMAAWYSRSSGLEGSGKSLVGPFEDAIFSLKDGEISKKVLTDYGIHIIRRDSSKQIDPAQDMDELKKLYKRIYFESDKREYLDNIEKNYGFGINKQNLAELLTKFDSTKTNLDTNWQKKITDDLKSKVLYTFNGKNHKVAELVDDFAHKAEFRGNPTNEDGIRKAIAKKVDPEAFDLATQNLENEYADFANLMREFRDGILLFKVEALEVWDKLKFDSTLARSYWDTTKTKYKTQPTYDISEIYVMSDSLAKDIYSKAIKGDNFGDLAEKFTQRSGFREKKGSWGKKNIKESEFARMASDKKATTGTILEPVKYENGFSVLKVNNFEAPRMKTFEEAIPDFAPEVQEIIQKSLIDKWLGHIRSEFPVDVNQAELDKVVSYLKNK